jgi:hypothetical protein
MPEVTLAKSAKSRGHVGALANNWITWLANIRWGVYGRVTRASHAPHADSARHRITTLARMPVASISGAQLAIAQ